MQPQRGNKMIEPNSEPAPAPRLTEFEKKIAKLRQRQTAFEAGILLDRDGNEIDTVATIDAAIKKASEGNQYALTEADVITALYTLRRAGKYQPIRDRINALGAKASIQAIEKLMDQRDEPKGNKSSIQHGIDRLNKTYSHVLFGGNARIAKEVKGKRIEFINVDSFHSHFANDTVEITVSTPSGEKLKKVPISKIWLVAGERRTFDGIRFLPGAPHTKDYLNLWRGFTVEPINEGVFWCGMKVRRFLSHLKYNVCGGNREEFRYLLFWCADMFQNPGRKPGVAVAISGRKGIGKTKIAEVLSALLGVHATSVSSERHLTGNFNAHKAQTLLLVAEEAFWAGNKSAEGTLKHEITSAKVMAEFKNVDAYEEKSFLRILFLSNEAWIFPATEDERRLAAFACGDKHINDYAYFSAMDDQLFGKGKREYDASCDEPPFGLQALLTFFLRLDLSRFNVRAAPETAALEDQRASTLTKHAQFFLDALNSRNLGLQSSSDIDYNKESKYWDEPSFIHKDDLYDEFVNSILPHERKHLLAKNAFCRWIVSNLGWKTHREQAASAKERIGMKRGYYWKVPSWDDVVIAFEKSVKVRVTKD
jgi:Family of unknown function (DUF5906)